MIQIKVLTKSDLPTLMSTPEGVFDHPIDERFAAKFLSNPHHHIVVAISYERMIGFASAVHYIHPDKPPELWINEVSVASSHQQQGVGKALMQAILKLGQELGCINAWVLTEGNNMPANNLYQATGGITPSSNTIMYEFDLTKE